jgi:hypothetical protein
MFIDNQFLSPWWWRCYIPPKRRFLQEPHGITSQKTAFFIVTAVKTSNLMELCFLCSLCLYVISRTSQQLQSDYPMWMCVTYLHCSTWSCKRWRKEYLVIRVITEPPFFLRGYKYGDLALQVGEPQVWERKISSWVLRDSDLRDCTRDNQQRQ